MRISHTTRLGATLALTLVAVCTAAQASKVPPGAVPKQEGKSCPDGWKQESYSRPAGQTGLDRWCIPPKDKGSSSSSSGSSGHGYSGPAAKFSLPKPDKLLRCPSSYYSNSENTQCVSHLDEPLTTAPKRGACPAGTLEEWGAWCTTPSAKTDDLTLDRIEGARTRDFNVVYLAHQLAGKPVPSFQDEPEAFKQAKAARVAAGNPWKERHVRDREAEQAKQAGAKAEEGGADGQASGDPVANAAKDTAKEVGKALRGLLGR